MKQMVYLYTNCLVNTKPQKRMNTISINQPADRPPYKEFKIKNSIFYTAELNNCTFGF